MTVRGRVAVTAVALLGVCALSGTSLESASANPDHDASAVVVAATDSRVAVPRCRSWTSYGWGDDTDHYWTKRPTTRRNNSRWNCKLHRGYRNEGVKVLKVALNRCHGAHLSIGPRYTRQTERVVNRVRHNQGLGGHGYGPRLRERMKWPDWHNGDFDGCTRG